MTPVSVRLYQSLGTRFQITMHPAIRVNRPYPSSKVWANPIHAIPVSRLILLALLFRYGRRNAGPPHLQTNPCRGTRASISKDIRSMSLFRPTWLSVSVHMPVSTLIACPTRPVSLAHRVLYWLTNFVLANGKRCLLSTTREDVPR